MKNTIFTGAGVAIVTPFNLDGTVNYEEFAMNLDYQIDNGTDAIIVCGTTGESATLSDEEHVECIRFAVEHVNKRIPVIAGTGSNDTDYAVQLSQEAEKCGADGLLLVTPYYNKTSQAGLVAHFTMIANSVNIPIILYNVPSRTGMNIAIDTYTQLAGHKNIVAVKEASGNISYVAKLFERCGDQLDIYSGNDDMIVPVMSLGGAGVISVLSNILPRETHEITQFCLKGDFKSATALQLKYLELINALFSEVNPIPIKEAMNLMGMNVGSCRMPLVRMTSENLTTLVACLQKHKLIPEL
ncbi:4-hydroxy-tetrahydrodipicolinate synthase [Ruminococcus champanellensis]|uniref:4-hydroxy-tetrahydrodipicolinate synthase n=1 Tax=Ruminococcus champanellensis TaxID=1161942 RepID=UPI00248C87B5|nr:4-hydroxy-tetrahydrodipicolinate synthase [Ruminococcus champanellensis]